MVSFRYLSSQPVFTSARLSIRGIGLREVMPALVCARPEGTGDCFFLLFHDSALVEDSEQPAGTIVLWADGAGHFYGNPREKWSHSWIHCQGPLVNETLEREQIVSGEPIPLFNPARVERYLLDLHEELHGPLKPENAILENTLENLIVEAARSRNAPLRRTVPEALTRARLTIEARYDERLTLNRLAAEAHLSAPHFCGEFRRWFGMPPMAYLARRRMEAGAVLLRETALDVQEVAARVGFEDPYHFSRQFKKSFGVAPSKFRR